jgi:hypothetical protein
LKTKRDLEFLDASVVVVAEAHNPSILHPAFLEAQGIAPSTWTLAEAPICTPALSFVRYSNGIVFTVDARKLQVLQMSPPRSVNEIGVSNLAQKYVECLPHVPYRAVGVNFSAVVEDAHASTTIIDRFLKQDAIQDQLSALKAVGLRFVLALDSGELRIDCDPGEVETATGKKSGILVKANSHTDLDPGRRQAATEVISTFSDRFQSLAERTRLILGLEL